MERLLKKLEKLELDIPDYFLVARFALPTNQRDLICAIHETFVMIYATFQREILLLQRAEWKEQEEKVTKVAQELCEAFGIDIEIIKSLINEKNTKKRNALFLAHGITNADDTLAAQVIIMEERRKLQNCEYAKKKREKIERKIEDLTAQNNALLGSIKKNNEEKAASMLKTKELKERALQLANETEELERNIEEMKQQLQQEIISRQIEETWKINYNEEILPDVWLIPPTNE